MSKLNVDQQTPFMDKQRPACDKSSTLNIFIPVSVRKWSMARPITSCWIAWVIKFC